MEAKPDSVRDAARLLVEAADFYRMAAKLSPSLGQLSSKADELARVGDALQAIEGEAKPIDGSSKDVGTARVIGCWALRSPWLGGPDEPPGEWVAFDAAVPEHVAAKEAVDLVLSQQQKAPPGESGPDTPDAVRLSFPHFLPGVTLVHLARGTSPGWDAVFNITTDKDGLVKARSFDFGSPEVHRLNFETPLNILGHDLEYLRYFMHIVRGADGAFRILENRILERARPHLEALALSNDRGPVLDAVHSPRLQRIAGDGGVVYSAWILYAGAVFTAQLATYPDGRVDMLDDDPQVTSVSALVG